MNKKIQRKGKKERKKDFPPRVSAIAIFLTSLNVSTDTSYDVIIIIIIIIITSIIIY
jgi:hypothetical protein